MAQMLSQIVEVAGPRRAPLRARLGPPVLVVASYGRFSEITSEITMSTSLEVLEAEVLKLDPADRSHLLERLIASLDADPEVEEAWALEADRREASLASGAVAEVSAQEAMNRLRQRLVR